MHFFTATINNWQNLLKPDKYKTLIVNSLKWMNDEKRAATHGFVIMPNHIHILWSPIGKFEAWENENTLIRYTAHALLKDLKEVHPEVLKRFISTQADRNYQFWERRSRTIEIKSREIALQKLVYIHNNPLQEKWKLVENPLDYHFSSARFYENLVDDFEFLVHYIDFI